ncbi:MAG: ATP-binding protein [Ilumatobacter sp.]|uniref:ATP-binding protein n=1 Tax=Ilumatobacter sp. TaxID=1967498 RepID=UPI00391AF2F0
MASRPRNPFTPGFGRHPTIVVGRDEILADAREAFGDDWHPTRKMLLQAHRGSGKTVLLDEIQDIATAAGWLVVQEDAGTRDTSISARLTTRLLSYLDEHDPDARRRITGGSVSVLGIGASVSTELSDDHDSPGGLRETLEAVLDLDDGRPTGVLLSIDEIHEASRDDVHAIGNAIQHLDRSSQPIGVLLAGLPPDADVEKEPTFLSRCHAPKIEILRDDEIEQGLIETAATAGWVFDSDALELAVNTTAGFPYMMQLVGWEATKVTRRRREGTAITYGDVALAVPEARRTLARSVLFHIDKRLTPTEKEFLVAMAHDSGPSKMKDIRERMGQTAQYVNVYRNRLLDASLIQQIKHGHVDFAVPGHRAELRADVGYAAAQASHARRND